MCILFYFHEGELWGREGWNLPYISAIAGKKCSRSTNFRLGVTLGPLGIS